MYIIWLPLPLSKSYTDAHTIMWLAKSCTGWQVVYPTSCKFLYIPCGAGIQPSSVANLYAKTKPTPATLVSCGTWEKAAQLFVLARTFANPTALQKWNLKNPRNSFTHMQGNSKASSVG